VTEMLRHYWSEVHVVKADKTIVAATAKSSSSSSAVFLVPRTWMGAYATCIQVHCISFCIPVYGTRNVDCVTSALLTF